MAVPSDISYWVYKPTKGISIAFAVLFFISGVLHGWQNNLKYKGSWRVGFLFPWAAALFVAGLITREYGAYHTDNLGVFVASTVLLFIAPPVYNGADYFIFGRLLYYVPYLSPIHPGRVWTTFVALDAIDGIIAGNGASYAANTENSLSKIKMGVILVKVSLFLLLGMANVFSHNVKVVVYSLYLSAFLILIRNTFRTAAFFYPPDSTANGKEWIFWVLEVVPMLLNSYLLNVYPPLKYLPRNDKIYLAMDGKTEIEGPGMVENRPFLLTLVDPFDLVGLATGQDNKNRFWEHDGIGGPGGSARRANEDEPESVHASKEIHSKA
ncbi:RTA1 domain protein [Cladophialophora carrionii]|uniref:RTA1 domain protein n=1 Tax=Cladophialophora carrionii TaxID=86049 RepID=A0A1C1CZ87_9EURO|nr:RTA1 domain protein [Cladophialophora carrionii]